MTKPMTSKIAGESSESQPTSQEDVNQYVREALRFAGDSGALVGMVLLHFSNLPRTEGKTRLEVVRVMTTEALFALAQEYRCHVCTFNALL